MILGLWIVFPGLQTWCLSCGEPPIPRLKFGFIPFYQGRQHLQCQPQQAPTYICQSPSWTPALLLDSGSPPSFPPFQGSAQHGLELAPGSPWCFLLLLQNKTHGCTAGNTPTRSSLSVPGCQTPNQAIISQFPSCEKFISPHRCHRWRFFVPKLISMGIIWPGLTQVHISSQISH